MAKGQEAKNLVVKKITEAFGEDFIGEYNKRYYVWSKEDGQKVQIAISLTGVKEPVGEVKPTAAGHFFGTKPETVAPPTFTPAETTEEEMETLAEMMARLGL